VFAKVKYSQAVAYVIRACARLLVGMSKGCDTTIRRGETWAGKIFNTRELGSALVH